MALILDTGPLYALLDRRDAAHHACRSLIEATTERLLIPSPVLPEVDYFVGQRLGAAPLLTLLDDVMEGAFSVIDLIRDDYIRVRQLCDQYADSDIGFVDAAVVSIAERLDEPKIATLDRRHFGLIRPRHVAAFTLLPDVPA